MDLSTAVLLFFGALIVTDLFVHLVLRVKPAWVRSKIGRAFYDRSFFSFLMEYPWELKKAMLLRKAKKVPCFSENEIHRAAAMQRMGVPNDYQLLTAHVQLCEECLERYILASATYKMPN